MFESDCERGDGQRANTRASKLANPFASASAHRVGSRAALVVRLCECAAASVLALACAPASEEREPFEALPHAAPVELRAEQGLALSPDAQQLLWEREAPSAPPRLELYELGAGRTRAIEWSPAALAALGSTPLVSWSTRCWSADSREVFARVEGGWLRASSTDEPPQWRVCETTPGELFEVAAMPVEGLVRVESDGERLAIRAVRDGRLLAEHAPSGALRKRVELRAGSLRASHDGAWVCYALVEAGDAWVGVPSLYVLSTGASSPAPLCVSARCWGAPQWSTRESRLYFVHAADGEHAVVASWSP